MSTLTGRRLLLVEQDEDWEDQPLATLPVPDELRAELAGRTTGAGAEVLLIRRPDRYSSAVCFARSWCVVDPDAAAGQRLTWGSWAYPTDLLAAVDRVEELAAAGPDEGTTGDPALDEPAGQDVGATAHQAARGPARHLADVPLVLICTQGAACRSLGSQVARQLARRWPEPTWECSHPEGRSAEAAHALLLPAGERHAGLTADMATALVGRTTMLR